jgi:hypothetical protein
MLFSKIRHAAQLLSNSDFFGLEKNSPSLHGKPGRLSPSHFRECRGARRVSLALRTFSGQLPDRCRRGYLVSAN